MGNLIALIVYVGIIVVIFLLCRELLCWYWKINEHLENQRKILEKLEKLEKLDNIERFLKYIDQNTMKKDNQN